ncbi:MAG: nucleotide sugar dehydrogenase [Chloroflexi bacterium]|nr:nucleotide sugar dehydrogenase [Chloroflexota bacterium]
MTTYRDLLTTGQRRIGIWGIGSVGFSTMAFFAHEGVRGIGVDTNPERVEGVNRGRTNIVGMADWLGFPLEPLARKGLMHATGDYRDLLTSDVLVHFVAIPTERQGQPFHDLLVDVTQRLCQLADVPRQEPPLVIIESTLTPGTLDRIVIPIFRRHGFRIGESLFLGVAPRRDWFVEETRSLKNLARVYGGVEEKSTREIGGVLSIVCDDLHAAKDHKAAEMVKSIENAYRHMDITLANQLSLAFPHADMREILRLVGTKWNINTYFPSVGTGGYCIPISSLYVLEGAERPETLTLLQQTVDTDRSMPIRVANSLLRRGMRSVGILGLSYKGNVKVPELSPAIFLAQALKEGGATVRLADPYFKPEEIVRWAGVETFAVPEELDGFDALVVINDHREFTTPQVRERVLRTRRCRVILDNAGAWAAWDLQKAGLPYYLTGQAGWLEEPPGAEEAAIGR